MVTPNAVPEEWPEPAWLKVFNRRELAYLSWRLDASNSELRITCRKLAEQLRRATTTTPGEET